MLLTTKYRLVLFIVSAAAGLLAVLSLLLLQNLINTSASVLFPIMAFISVILFAGASLLAAAQKESTARLQSLSGTASKDTLTANESETSDPLLALERCIAKSKEESELKARAIIENSLDVICVFDYDFRFVSVNSAASRSWGYEKSELIGRKLSEFLVESDVSSSFNQMAGARQSVQKISFENRLKSKDESILHLLWSAHWSASDNGLFCVAHDVSERHALEQFKKDFLAMVSHDIRTPLCSIGLTLDFLDKRSREKLDEQESSLIETAICETERLMALTQGLLDSERLQVGMLPMEFRDISMRQVIESAIKSITPTAKKARVTIVASQNELRCDGDRDRLLQVVLNLLSNAVKYSPAGGEVVVRLATGADEHIRVTVTDSGPGIAAEDSARIFGKFQQLKDSSETYKKGSGVGLAICKAIIEQHHGTIGVESQLGKGSTFWFQIPQRQTRQIP